MALDKYRLPLCLTEGVSFTLDDAPEVTITVKMPIAANRDFMFAWAKLLPVGADGNIAATPFDMTDAQRRAFFPGQVISVKGVDAANFWDDYPLAKEEIWTKVQNALPGYETKLEAEAKN
jgi:hypothetical protein